METFFYLIKYSILRRTPGSVITVMQFTVEEDKHLIKWL